MSESNPTTPLARLTSLDAYRGFVMLAMASGGLGLTELIKKEDFKESPFWKMLAAQVSHVEWRGCVFWDLIQPSFMFMVGVAVPFSMAARTAAGQSWGQQFGHAIRRSIVLVLLGIFLASIGKPSTNFLFTNVLAQIGLGYTFVFLLAATRPFVQWNAVSLILIGYWAWFALDPHTADSGSLGTLSKGLEDPVVFTKFSGHWAKDVNPAARFDTWFLNLFPRPEGKPYTLNDGGYATLNFIPSTATMILGLIAGSMLKREGTHIWKVGKLIIMSAMGLLLGWLLDRTICPSVKRIWTPSWVIFSAGWTCAMLATFYFLIEEKGWKSWSFPLVVVGSNSIAMYLMAQLIKPFVKTSLVTHLDLASYTSGPYGPPIASSVQLFTLWLICLWMYRSKLFVKI